MAEHANNGAADTIFTGLSAIWNYHIPFDSIVLIIGVVVLIPAGVYLAFFLYGTGIVLVRMATWTGVNLWDLLTIAWLLSRRSACEIRRGFFFARQSMGDQGSDGLELMPEVLKQGHRGDDDCPHQEPGKGATGPGSKLDHVHIPSPVFLA